MNLPIHRSFFRSSLRWMLAGLTLLVSPVGVAEEAAEEKAKREAVVEAAKSGKEFKLPGLTIRTKEKWVDVEASVALNQGMLELIACTPETKVHESILSVEAKPSHIHAALLLIGARPGNPAMRKPIDEEQTRWVDLPPRGQGVDVFLAFESEEGKEVEYPISRFLTHIEEDYSEGKPVVKEHPFETHTFLFAGSHLYTPKDGKPRYLADESGHVISISTFGDELLCLPGHHAKDNGALVWEVDSDDLPKVDSKVILRLKPKFAKAETDEKKSSTSNP